MTTPTGEGPTWFDVLGVERDASADDVRAAWRAATDRAEPGTGQFRAANQAAETLLDPARRAAYDQTPASPAPDPTGEAAPAPAAAAPVAAASVEQEPADGRRSRRRRREPRAEGPAAPGRVPTGRAVRLLGSLPLWVLALLVVLAVVLAGLTVWLGMRVSDQAREADARLQAPVAAEQAAVAMLSYDYEQLPQDQARAEGYLTGDFKAEFLKNFRLLEEQEDGSPGLAVQTKTVTTAQVKDSAVMGVGDDARTVRVLLFVNQTAEKQGQDPQVFLNRVVMTMSQVGDRWLVGELDSY